MSKAVVIPEGNKDVGGMKEEISVSPSDKKDGAMGLISRFLRFESLKRNNSSESPTSTEPPTTYYGVYIPCEIKKGPDEEALHVYKNKSEALELVRRYKAARFKAFTSRQDAISFALRGAESVDTVDGNNSVMGEKPYPFKAPSPQDMVSLRKQIEAGHIDSVRERVWDNPRFLVSSGNTPAIMQEGCRYNALHVAAKCKNAEMCNLVLTTVGNPAFVQTLYGADADAEACKEFAQILVDRYLNTPDKARNETPLHFAACYGADAVVDVLTSFPQCDTGAVNKFGERPHDVICKRVPDAPADASRRISRLLRARYYVPVLHCEDDSGAPTIGPAFTPKEPPEMNPDPLSPRVEIRAFAGPMEPRAAAAFRRRWKTPPRAPAFRLRDLAKGLETVGRDLAEEMEIGWNEYWPFLDTFTDLRTPEGLALLEEYLKSKYENACSIAYHDSFCEARRSENRGISKLNLSDTPLSEMSPISELCAAMKTCKISSDARRAARWMRIEKQTFVQPVTFINGDAPQLNRTVSQILCIERTCQVFAKRITDALTFSITAEPELAGEALKSEAKHLQHTISSYMDDRRFQTIDFALIHSRLAQLVVYKLKQAAESLEEINILVEFLSKIRCPNDDIFSSDDERKPLNKGSKSKTTQVIDTHVRCISNFLCEEMNEDTKGPSMTESACREVWEKATKCRCDWAVEQFERNSKKNASFRKNRSILSTGSKNENIIRRLTFDHDIGDGALQRAEAARPVSVNSPGGDGGTYTIDVAKCTVVEAEISDDDSCGSASSYETASEHADSDADMEDASDAPLADTFIYGSEPTKMDRLVLEAICQCSISAEQYPHVYRWRHYVSLYSASERDRWQSASPDCSLNRSLSVSLCSPPRRPAARSTPHKAPGDRDNSARALPLQVSSWLRVTGANSPRGALASKNVEHNVSFGF